MTVEYPEVRHLLMALGFTESKADSNLCFKVEGERLVILLLYVDEVFLTGKEHLIKDARRRLTTEFEIKGLGMMHYFLGNGGVAKCRWNLPWTREVCSGDPEEVRGDGLQGHGHTYGIEPEAIE